MKTFRFVALGILAASLAGPAYPAAAPQSRQLTLLVVPARYNVLQVSFDAASVAPVVLVSYQGDATTETPLLHAWNGTEWVYVSAEDFREAQFLQVTPGQAILVGDESLLPPMLVTSVGAWCPKTLTVPATDPAGLVNALGAHLDFAPSEWKWMAARYNMDLTDLNAERRSESWYDQKGYEDELTPRLQSLPKHRRGRPAAGSAAPAMEPAVVPPAEVVPPAKAVEPDAAVPASEEIPPAEVVTAVESASVEDIQAEEPAAEPRLSIPSPGEEPKKGRKSRAEKKADEAAAASGAAPEGWQEKASTDSLPVK